ncbi:hypothetical protein [Chromobacterium alticapitis]|uniref:Uncharacterized protein n=1 Tax=Chromobacterium alticapitis TaxID=2073169 RepID=A0A2S5DHI5_9NEIS|nr:hypothetical protein [Chromobacterium alticapitis]POZ62546.1 hypothetical protein C2I19_07690 [Chromobacterium alticapitis]
MNIPDFNLPPIQLIRPLPQQLSGVQSSGGSSADPQREFAEMLHRSAQQPLPLAAPSQASALAAAFSLPAALGLRQERPSRQAQARSASRAYASSRPTIGTLLQTEA